MLRELSWVRSEELTNVHINITQNVSKKQFPNLGGLQCTLLQAKGILIEIKSKKEPLIFYSLDCHHWIVASTINNRKMKSKFLILSSGMLICKQKQILSNLFGHSTIKVMNSQKQKGVKDC